MDWRRRYSIVDEDDIDQALTAVQVYVGQRAAERNNAKNSAAPIALSKAWK